MKNRYLVHTFKFVVALATCILCLVLAGVMVYLREWIALPILALIFAIFAYVTVLYGSVVSVDEKGVHLTFLGISRRSVPWSDIREVGIVGVKVFNNRAQTDRQPLHLLLPAPWTTPPGSSSRWNGRPRICCMSATPASGWRRSSCCGPAPSRPTTPGTHSSDFSLQYTAKSRFTAALLMVPQKKEPPIEQCHRRRPCDRREGECSYSSWMRRQVAESRGGRFLLLLRLVAGFRCVGAAGGEPAAGLAG